MVEMVVMAEMMVMVVMVEMVVMVVMVVLVVLVVMMMATIFLINPKYAQGKDARWLAFALYPVRIPHYTAWLT